MRPGYKFVRFDLYCSSCENKNLPECDDPCNECLGIPAREGTAEPEYYKEDKSDKAV